MRNPKYVLLKLVKKSKNNTDFTNCSLYESDHHSHWHYYYCFTGLFKGKYFSCYAKFSTSLKEPNFYFTETTDLQTINELTKLLEL